MALLFRSRWSLILSSLTNNVAPVPRLACFYMLHKGRFNLRALLSALVSAILRCTAQA